MSLICDLALVAGLTLGGHCTAKTPPLPVEAMPPDDPAAWALPVSPPPPPAPPPVFPPVIIREVAAPPPPPLPLPPPAPKPEPEPEPDPAPATAPPDPVAEALRARWAIASTPGMQLASAPATLPAAGLLVAPPRPTGSGSPDLGPMTPKAPPAYQSERSVSSQPVDNSRIITADRYVIGILETSINSQIGGEDTGTVIVQTARDVYGYHGRRILLPKGTRLICDYRAPEDIGSSRIPMACRRALIAGHRAEIRNLDSLLIDQQGRVGTTGEVDSRFWERYGTAFALTGISTAVRYATTVSQTSKGDETASAAAQSRDAGAQELSTRLGEVSAKVLEQTMDLKPIITIPQGTRIHIRPDKDWYLAMPEES